MSPDDRLWRAQDLIAMPWRNGGGVTYEIAGEPVGASLDDFEWRVSLAAVAAPGPFSTFDGVDRIIALIDGTAMELTIDGTPRALQPFQPFAFAGESLTTCEIPAGPTRDLNVMTRRRSVAATLEFLAAPAHLTAAWRSVVIGLSGRVEVDGVQLAPLDGLVRADAAIAVTGTGRFAAVSLTPRVA